MIHQHGKLEDLLPDETPEGWDGPFENKDSNTHQPMYSYEYEQRVNALFIEKEVFHDDGSQCSDSFYWVEFDSPDPERLGLICDMIPEDYIGVMKEIDDTGFIPQ